jgi:methionyl-tRNA formyltransferase
MLARARVAIDPDETSGELENRLASLGANLLVNTVDALARGDVIEEAQDERAATYANRLDRTESRVDWARPAVAVHNQIRGLQPWPVAAVSYRGKRLLLLGSAVADDRPTDAIPGTVLSADPDSLLVATRPGTVRITRVQLEGRPPLAVRDFLHGHRIRVGDRFDD